MDKVLLIVKQTGTGEYDSYNLTKDDAFIAFLIGDFVLSVRIAMIIQLIHDQGY